MLYSVDSPLVGFLALLFDSVDPDCWFLSDWSVDSSSGLAAICIVHRFPLKDPPRLRVGQWCPSSDLRIQPLQTSLR